MSVNFLNSQSQPVSAVPTNIITGFLGVGKTSALLHLLRQKPSQERWAILVNEFGEVGVDGNLLSGNKNTTQSVYVAEVPGGCMCCAAGLPMQIALNQLLIRAKPQRLLIEPTGLGHPKEVMETLSSHHYREVLQLQKTITLVDARKLQDSRYTGHNTFNQQIAIADVIIGNKIDLYQGNEQSQLTHYVKKVNPKKVPVYFTQQGQVDLTLLEGRSQFTSESGSHHHFEQSRPLASEQPLPSNGILKAHNEGQGYQSIGWRFSPHLIFNRHRLIKFLKSLDIERAKAIFITEAGIFGYNLTRDGLTELELDECLESRLEVLGFDVQSSIEQKVMSCLEG